MLDIGQEPSVNTLGGRIKAVRTALKLPLGDTANKIGVSRTSLGQWEADAVTNPDIDKLAAFTRLTDISLDWLVEGKGNTPPFLAGRRGSRTAPAASPDGEDQPPRRTGIEEVIPEIAAPLTSHALNLDMTPKALWSIPREVLELAFNIQPGRAVMMRVITRDGGEFGVARGDYVLVDTSRTWIDEPGLYLVADPDGQSARRAKVEFNGDQLTVVIMGDDLQRRPAELVGVDLIALGRVMGIFKPV